MAKKVIFFGKNFADIKLRLNFASKYHSLWAIKQKSITNLNSTIMKKIFTLALVAVASLAAISVNAQTRVDGDNGMWSNITGDPNVKIYAQVGSSSNLAAVPVYIYLSSPDTAMCAFETYIKGIDPKLFYTDAYVQGPLITTTNVLGQQVYTHNVVLLNHTDRYKDEAFYVSLTGSGNPTFTSNEGLLVTLYFNATNLEDNTYNLQLVDAFAVTNDKVATGSHTTSWFPSTEQLAENAGLLTFAKADGKVTGINSATTEDVANAKGIYTLNGTKVTAPQKGQIYVIDGKVVKY